MAMYRGDSIAQAKWNAPRDWSTSLSEHAAMIERDLGAWRVTVIRACGESFAGCSEDRTAGAETSSIVSNPITMQPQQYFDLRLIAFYLPSSIQFRRTMNGGAKGSRNGPM